MASMVADWRLEGPSAFLDCGPLQARVDFSFIDERLSIEKWRGQTCNHFFVLNTTGRGGAARPGIVDREKCEYYVRGNDLVAIFPKDSPQGLTFELYWRTRLHESFNAVQIELIYSIQTDLLDSPAEEIVQSIVMGCDMFHCRDLLAAKFETVPRAETIFDKQDSRSQLIVLRNRELGLSYAEMVHPSDFVNVHCMPQTDWSTWHFISTLFPENLEKGVIRRGRICAWFMPSENDLQTAVELARQFVDEPLPLTT